MKPPSPTPKLRFFHGNTSMFKHGSSMRFVKRNLKSVQDTLSACKILKKTTVGCRYISAQQACCFVLCRQQFPVIHRQRHPANSPQASPPPELTAAGVCQSGQCSHKTLQQQVDSIQGFCVCRGWCTQTCMYTNTLTQSKPVHIYGLALSYWNVPSHTAERCKRP